MEGVEPEAKPVKLPSPAGLEATMQRELRIVHGQLILVTICPPAPAYRLDEDARICWPRSYERGGWGIKASHFAPNPGMGKFVPSKSARCKT